jgi:hypothetical protein
MDYPLIGIVYITQCKARVRETAYIVQQINNSPLLQTTGCSAQSVAERDVIEGSVASSVQRRSNVWEP